MGHGYDKGASGRKVSDKGFEIDITSEFSTPLAELKELGVRTLELSCQSIEKEDEPIGEKLQSVSVPVERKSCCFFHVGNKHFFLFLGVLFILILSYYLAIKIVEANNASQICVVSIYNSFLT